MSASIRQMQNNVEIADEKHHKMADKVWRHNLLVLMSYKIVRSWGLVTAKVDKYCAV